MKLTNKLNGEQINWKSGNAVVINGKSGKSAKSAKSADVILVREVNRNLNS
jgi:hypothetical protein